LNKIIKKTTSPERLMNEYEICKTDLSYVISFVLQNPDCSVSQDSSIIETHYVPKKAYSWTYLAAGICNIKYKNHSRKGTMLRVMIKTMFPETCPKIKQKIIKNTKHSERKRVKEIKTNLGSFIKVPAYPPAESIVKNAKEKIEEDEELACLVWGKELPAKHMEVNRWKKGTTGEYYMKKITPHMLLAMYNCTDIIKSVNRSISDLVDSIYSHNLDITFITISDMKK